MYLYSNKMITKEVLHVLIGITPSGKKHVIDHGTILMKAH